MRLLAHVNPARHVSSFKHTMHTMSRSGRRNQTRPVSKRDSRTLAARKQAEAQLARERDLLNALLDNVPDTIYFKDLQSRFVRVSKSKLEGSFAIARNRHQSQGAKTWPPHLASLERFAEYLPGKTDFDFFEEARARSAYEDEQMIICTGVPIVGKIERTPQLDGNLYWRLTTKLPWRDQQGKIIGTIGISKDITPIKEAEAKLDAAHKKLLETSRQAGMAEVATGVLHNVGNVLNSVNVSATLLRDAIKGSKAAGLAKAAALLREHAADLAEFISRDPKGRQLPLYLEQLAERLASDQAAWLDELASLARNVEHIKNIVAMQQSYARVAGVTEIVNVTDLVEDALRLNAAALTRHEVEVCREYDPAVPDITVDKHKVLQILINVIRNAKYACDESDQPDKRLTVRIAHDAHQVRISVTDNGVGIASENLTRIFSLGFTTRKEGHGFGLHSGALAAKELGGCLVAHSDGLGQGATFTLELPFSPPA